MPIPDTNTFSFKLTVFEKRYAKFLVYFSTLVNWMYFNGYSDTLHFIQLIFTSALLLHLDLTYLCEFWLIHQGVDASQMFYLHFYLPNISCLFYFLKDAKKKLEILNPTEVCNRAKKGIRI